MRQLAMNYRSFIICTVGEIILCKKIKNVGQFDKKNLLYTFAVALDNMEESMRVY